MPKTVPEEVMEILALVTRKEALFRDPIAPSTISDFAEQSTPMHGFLV